MKIIAISDTHGSHSRIELPETDILIHSGDFTGFSVAEESEFYDFIDWYSIQKAKYKILVAGNHDGYIYKHNKQAREYMEEKNIIYLEDSSVIIEGYKFYGTPWSLTYANWDFMLTEERISMPFALIEEDTDILISHSPAYGYLDTVDYGNHLGSISLTKKILSLPKLKYHIFGHIHESRGKIKRHGIEFINSAANFRKNHTYTELYL